MKLLSRAEDVVVGATYGLLLVAFAIKIASEVIVVCWKEMQ